MSVDKKLAELEKLAKELENEKSFDKSVENFSKAAILVKEVLAQTEQAKGRVLEIVKDVESIIEREIKLDDCDDED